MHIPLLISFRFFGNLQKVHLKMRIAVSIKGEVIKIPHLHNISKANVSYTCPFKQFLTELSITFL